MSLTLYFAKLNLISDDIFDLYEKPEIQMDIVRCLYGAIKKASTWTKEIGYTDNDGAFHVEEIEYSLQILNEDAATFVAEGWLYKKSLLHYNKKDNNSGELVKCVTDCVEASRFVVDAYQGLVGYNTGNRFGYKEFTEAFQEIVNAGEALLEQSYRYSVSICTKGIDLEDIKSDLKKIGKIKELEIKMQPPNPNKELLEELQRKTDGLTEEFRTANVTEMSVLYSTKGTKGINIEKPIVSDKLDELQGLYSTLAAKDLTKNGYASVNATSFSGTKYASGERKPVKKVVGAIEDCWQTCREMFGKIH